MSTPDPLRHLPSLRALRERLSQLPAEAPQRAAALAELEAALLATRPVPRELLPRRQRALMAGFVLCAGLAGYAVTGNLQGWISRPAADPGEAMVKRLAERLAAQPEAAGAADWAMLGRSQAVLGRHAEAVAAYRRALALQPDADTLSALADLLVSAQGGQFRGEPGQLVAQALALAPDHPRTLALAAARAWQENQLDEARRHWKRLQAVLPPEDPLQATAKQGLALADARKP